MFARLIFYGVSLLGQPEREVWLMPLGSLLDQWEVYRQVKGIASVKEGQNVEEIIRNGI
ncbi:MAG: hypothetical protein VB068_00720 [Petrimonas sp.]|nr:hypothetical protein [Petrimonas sp.]